MSNPSRDSFENPPEPTDWASQQPEGDRSWAAPQLSKEPVNPYGPSEPFGGAVPYAAPGPFPGAPANAAPPANPYAQPYPAPQYGPPYGQPMAQQPYPQQFAPYGAPMYQAPPARGLSITGMVLGIASVGLFLWVFLLPPVAGLVFSILGLVKEPRGKGMAITGLILSGIGLLLCLYFVLDTGGWAWEDDGSYPDTSNA